MKLLTYSILALFLMLSTDSYAAKPADAPILLDDFEQAPVGWNYNDGREFPGGSGTLEIDSQAAHTGKASYKLAGDFTAGGAYVGMTRDLTQLKGQDFTEIHLWIKSKNVNSIGVRIIDGTDQCHQKNGGLPLAATSEWQQVVIKLAEVVGGEHWGGANDGKWHGPPKAFAINIGKTAFPEGSPAKGSINVDDIEVVPGHVVEGHPTLLTAIVNPPNCRPGFETSVTYRWDAQSMGRDMKVSVHMMAPDGKFTFQADHEPPLATSIWSGKVEYTNKLYVPIDTAEGIYRIVVGLYDCQGSVKLKTGPGVTTGQDGENAYQVGVVKVDANGPIPQLPAPSLDLSSYKITFDDEFNDLSVSAAGPGTRWFTATKETFGDARFVEQSDGFPFSIEKGILPDKSVLRIAAAKKNGAWCAGIIASADPKGGGFSQKFGYFEMRAKMPKSLGTWPAFWLLGQPSLTDKTQVNPEIDVVEWYGVLPHLVMSTLHLWYPDGRHTAVFDHIATTGLDDDFHRYGVMVNEQNVIYYFDGIEIQKQKTPAEAKVPLYMLVNLAMGSGWPTDKALDPSYFYVDYVRAYAKKP